MVECLVNGLMWYVFGMFTMMFLFGWEQGQSDRYTGIKWTTSVDTCVKYYGKGC